jgi:hypothetical protein
VEVEEELLARIEREEHDLTNRKPCCAAATRKPPYPKCGERAFLIEAGGTGKIYRPRDAGPDWQIDLVSDHGGRGH